jgi:hypothetical protein
MINIVDNRTNKIAKTFPELPFLVESDTSFYMVCSSVDNKYFQVSLKTGHQEDRYDSLEEMFEDYVNEDDVIIENATITIQ